MMDLSPIPREHLTVLLHCLDDNTFRMPDGRTLTPGELRAGNASPVTLVLPAVRTGLVSLPVSRKELAHLRKSLPWRLEEQLGVAPETLHFAHGPGQDGEVAVVYVDRNWLATLLQSCTANGVNVGGVVSELQLLPREPGSWTLEVRSDVGQVLIRDGRGQGLVCSIDNLASVLALLAQEETPAQLLCLNCNAEQAALIPERFRALMRSVPPVRSQDDLVAAAVNLRQGEFAVPLPWDKWWQGWRWAAALVVGLFLTDQVITRYETRLLEQRLLTAENALSEIFAETLPDAVMVDPLLQLQRAVAALDGSERAGLLSLLTRMAPVLSGTGGHAVQNLSWDDATGELQLLLSTDSFAAAEQFRAGLEALGLQAELLGSNSDASGSRARLRIRS
jgi:general secretion pathway protein L